VAERAWRVVQARLPRIKAHAARYLRIQADRGVLVLRSVVVSAVAWVLVVTTAGVALATAAFQAVTGLTEGLALLFGGRWWLARTVSGVASVVGVVLVLRGALWFLRWRHLRRLRHKYEPPDSTPPEGGPMAPPKDRADEAEKAINS
jgi:hypothetical protein